MYNRTAWLFFLLITGGLVFYRWAPLPEGWIEWGQWELAWPFALIISSLFAGLLARKIWNHREKVIPELRWIAVLTPFVLIVQCLEPHFLKVTYDEQAHLGVAYGMYSQGRCEMPLGAHLKLNFAGDPAIDLYGTTFRGYYFSVLVAALGRAIGFSESLAYWVNGINALGVLVLVYIMARKIGLPPIISPIPAILLLGAGIFGQVMCSGAYDMTNLLFLAFFIYFLSNFLETKARAEGRLLLLASLLLTFCRTESIVYFAIAVLAWLYIYRLKMHWEILATLPWTLPMLATQRVLTANPRNITQGEIKPGQEVWSLGNLFENWQDSIVYFLNLSPAKMGSLLLFIAGLGGIVALTLRVKKGSHPFGHTEKTLFITAIGATSLYSIVMGSFWGGPSIKLVMTRFTLPLWLTLSIASAYFLKIIIEKNGITTKVLWITTTTWFITMVMPTYAKRDVALNFDYALADKTMLEMAKQVDDGRTLFVYDSCASFVSRGLPCIEYSLLSNNVEKYTTLARMGTWNKIVFVELIKKLPDGKKGISRNPKWGNKRDSLITQKLLSKSYDPGWDLSLEEWTGLKTENGVIDIQKRDIEPPQHSSHNELTYKLRSLMPRE